MIKKIIWLMSGIPASGKSTWIQSRLNDESDVWCSRDAVRFSIVKEEEEYFSHEDLVFDTWINQIKDALDNSNVKNIYVDATHLNDKSRNKTLVRLPKDNIEKIVNVVFTTPLNICLERNAQRTGRARVPDTVICNMYNTFKNPSENETIFIDENGNAPGKIYLTSDLHFGHDREFVWKVRGFNSVQEMNETIVNRWNEIISDNDDIYVLGDVMLGSAENAKYIAQLKGKIHIALGNHDTDSRKEIYKHLPNVVEIADVGIKIKYKKYHFVLTHFPMLTGNLEKESLKQMSLNLYGHTHQTSNFYYDMPYMYHVGVDSHNCYPVLIDDIIKEMNNKVQECVDYLDVDWSGK